jgi:hypothetical protein
MKKLLFALFIAALLLPAQGVAQPFSLHWNATTVPVNHEPVVGNLVARYRLQLEPRLDWGRLHYHLQANAWGGQKWRPRHTLGEGFFEKYRNSDWSVETWRFSLLHRVHFDLFGDRLQLFSEYYKPIRRHEWGGHGMERHYYWLIGVGGRIF